MKQWVVFSEFLPSMERWYYGIYSDRDLANEIALNLNDEIGRGAGYSYCVCPAEEANDFKIKNLPLGLKFDN